MAPVAPAAGGDAGPDGEPLNTEPATDADVAQFEREMLGLYHAASEASGRHRMARGVSDEFKRLEASGAAQPGG